MTRRARSARPLRRDALVFPVLLAIAVAAPAAVVADDLAVNVEQEEEVQVEIADAPADGGSYVRAVGTIAASPGACLRALQRPTTMARSMPWLTEVAVVDRDGDRVRYIYTLVSPPFVSACDQTVRVEWTKRDFPSGRGFRQAWALAPEKGPPPRAGIRRVTKSEGAWDFEPADGGARTIVRMSATSDERMNWVVRSVAARAVRAAFEALRKAAEEEEQGGPSAAVTTSFASQAQGSAPQHDAR